MSIIKPFKAIRPTEKLASKVAALPYDVMNSDEARELVKDNPFSFLHVDKSEVDLDKSVDIHDDLVYTTAANNLNKMITDGVLIQDNKPCFYIYMLTRNKKSQTGLVICASIDEYINGTIKKHEFTREDKEKDRIRHVDTCNANTGPIFLAYHAKEKINTIIENWKQNNNPIYDFVADDGIGHKVWIVDCESTIKDLSNNFLEVENLYIADGHHRNASAVKVGLQRREENPNYTGNEEFNYYLAVAFPDNQLEIMDYNRLVKDLNNLSVNEFIEKIKEKFTIEDFEAKNPEKLHTFGMYLDKKWYKLTAKNDSLPTGIVENLDVSILQDNLLNPILKVGDPRTSKRIDFVGGIRGLKELEKRVNSGEMAVAFSMFPTSMKELMCVADDDKIMPPKSTWFEPKLRSGIFVHGLE